jgi:hypothetical protein
MPRARTALALAFVLVASLPVAHTSVYAFAIEPGAVGRTSVNLSATYDVDLAVRYSDRAVRLDSTATITNTSGGPIDRLELNTVAARLGAMTLDRVTVGGRRVSATIDDQTLIVPLGGILQSGDSAHVRVIIHATLRSTTVGSNWFFARSGGVITLYRAIPWVSLRRPFDRPNHGDPFLTPTSPRVSLHVTTDRPMVVAANATRTSVANGGRIQTFTASNVRDLPLAMAQDFRVATGRSGSTTVRVFGRPGAPLSSLLNQARRSLARESGLLGPYPWATYTVIEVAGGYAMEGPGTTWIPRDSDPARLEYLVAHETAHSWTPGLVGNDQWGDPFADEAMADLVARYTLSEFRASRCSTARFDLPITAYSSACYYEDIYIQGANWLNDLRMRMGNAVFWGAIRGYLAAHRFGIGSSRELLAALDAATPINVAALAADRFPSLRAVLRAG